MRARPVGQEEPPEEGTAPDSSILPGESHGQRSLEGYSPQGCKESHMTEGTWHACMVWAYLDKGRKILFFTIMYSRKNK